MARDVSLSFSFTAGSAAWLCFCSVNVDEEASSSSGVSEAAATTLIEAGKALEGSEAELVLLPLRLAFETKQAKIIEPALDCLHVSEHFIFYWSFWLTLTCNMI